MVSLKSVRRRVGAAFGIVAAALCLMLASCDATIHFYPESASGHRPDAGRIRVNVDWSGYGKEVPTGMTVICYHAESGKLSKTIANNTAYVTPYLLPGRHWAMVFNMTEAEFSYIGFRGLDAVETAEAYIRRQDKPKWNAGRADGDSYTGGEPEWLAVDTIMTDSVDMQGVVGQLGERVIGTLWPKNIIYTLHVTIHTENIGNLRSARASISGLASGRRLASSRPNDNSETVVHIIGSDYWTRTRTQSGSDMGFVRADIRCFGLPGNHRGEPEENELEFHAMLADGQTVLKYNIPVGHLVEERNSAADKRGDDLDLYLDLWLDPPLPPGGNSDWGFGAEVDDWDEEDDVVIPLG